MKLNLIQFIAFAFMLGWILSDVAGGDYQDKLIGGVVLVLVTAYLNNVHRHIWRRIRK